MKMQNAEMKIVIFDARDVITTSGPLFGKTLAAQIAAIRVYDTSYISVEDVMFNSIGNLAGITNVTDPGKDNNWLVYYGAGVDTNGITMAEGGSSPNEPQGSGYYKVRNTDENVTAMIADWLRDQRGQ